MKNDSYINGRQWLLQVTDDYIDEESGEIINRDGTWFDAIGTWNFHKNGEMAVNTLCRGNYVCRIVRTVEDLQLLFFALTGNKLELKDELEKHVKHLQHHKDATVGLYAFDKELDSIFENIPNKEGCKTSVEAHLVQQIEYLKSIVFRIK